MKRILRLSGIVVLLLGISVPLFAQHKRVEKVEVAAVPLVSYNKSFGGVFGAFGTVYFPMSANDTVSPASMGGAAGIVSTNKTWFGFGFAALYYDEDNFRSVIAGGTGTMNFQYYNDAISSGSFIGYSSVLNFLVIEQLVRVYDRFYSGIDFINYTARTTFDEGVSDSSKRRYTALGIPISYDSRDNTLNPTGGWYANMRFSRYDSLFGSSSEYTKLDIDCTNYGGTDTSHIIAAKASLSTGLGEVPFEAKTVVGGRILRGYSEGKYRGEQVYAAQAEYRWKFSDPWGAVFFGGLATTVNEGVSWSGSDLLPAVGAGIRYMLLPNLRVNIGFDAAIGKDDYGIYFRIGEAF